MTADRHLVLIGPHAALCERVKRAGIGVIVVDRPERLTADVIACGDHVIATDYTDVKRTAKLVTALAESGLSIEGVLSLTEPGLIPMAQLNDMLGVSDNSVEVVERIVDKDRMRRWLAADARFAVPAALVHDNDSLKTFIAAHGTPVIVKPHNGAGSLGVHLLSDGRIPDALDYPQLAEKYVQGREYSVEAMSLDGEHTIIGITEKVLFAGGFVERGHHFPAPLNDRESTVLHSFVRGFLDYVGLRSGLSHTEVIVTPDGPVIVETHTRNGGDHISSLVQLATGFDMLDVAVRARTGLIHEIPTVPETSRTAVIRYFAPPPGTIREVYGAHAARYLPGVVDLQLTARPGDPVRTPRSSLDRVGYVIAVGVDLDQASRHADAAITAVTLAVG